MPSLDDYSADALTKELRAREAAWPLEGETGFKDVAVYGEPDAQLAGFSSSEIMKAARTKQKAIYFVDSRADLSEVSDPHVLRLARSVTILAYSSDVHEDGEQAFKLKSDAFGTRYGLCPGERFWQQPCVGFGSGVLVAPDLVATAGHCVGEVNFDVARIRFLFGFRLGQEQIAPTGLAGEQVYSGRELVGHRLEPDGADWAIVRLDRPVANAPIAPVRRTGTVNQGTPVSIIGHPCGLPAKYATGAIVRDNKPTTFFKANLDAFGGNSGSPVFSRCDDGTCLVEGLLVRGNPDFVFLHDKKCHAALVIPAVTSAGIDPDGEHCSRVSEFLPLIGNGCEPESP